MNQEKIKELIQKLSECFAKHGRVLSRREYKRLKNRPCALNSIERYIGWGRAKDYAEINLKGGNWEKELEKVAGFERKASLDCDPLNEKRTEEFTTEPKKEIEQPQNKERSDQDILYGFGMKKPGITKRQWKDITEWIVELQKSVERLPKKKIEIPRRGGESLALLISDTHFGKMVHDGEGNQTYNKDISVHRIGLLREKFSRLIEERMRVNQLDEIYICLIGDIIDGAGIYPNQEQHQDINSFPKQICLGAACLWDLVDTLYKRYRLPIKIKAVRGNHGRQYKYALSGNNFDYMVYQLIYLSSNDRPEISVQYSMGAEFLNFTVKGQNVHMRHIAPSQAETAAGKAKFGGWRNLHNWDIMLFGHLHHPGNATFHESNIFMNGTIIGGDDLSERMATGSRPCQTAVLVDENEGVLGSRFLYVDEQDVTGQEAENLLHAYPGLDEPLR